MVVIRMYIPMYVNKTQMIGNGYRGAIRTWVAQFKNSCEFRKEILVFVLYCIVVVLNFAKSELAVKSN